MGGEEGRRVGRYLVRYRASHFATLIHFGRNANESASHRSAMLGPDELAFTPVVPDEPTVKELFPKEETPELTVAGKRVNKWKGQSMYPVLLEGTQSCG